MLKHLTKENRLRLIGLSFGLFACAIQGVLLTVSPPALWGDNPLPYILGFTLVAVVGGTIGAIGVRKFLDHSNQDQADQEPQ